MTAPAPELFPSEIAADKWLPQSLTSLKKLVGDCLALLNRIDGGGAAAVVAWHIAPDTTEPLQIDPQLEIIQKPYHAGQYRVRITGKTPGYYRCNPSADGAPSEVAGAMVDARRIESLNATLTMREETIAKLHVRIDEVRGERHDTEDKLREKLREIDELKAKIKSLEEDVENAAPFTEEQMIQILDVFATKMGDDDEDGKIAKLRGRLAKMLGATFALVGSIARDPAILTAILERHLEVWERYQATVNETAAEAGSKDRLGSGAQIVAHLLGAGIKLPSAIRALAPKAAKTTRKKV